MSAYKTDEEQVEALKKWWQDNGKSVIVGAVLGFGIIFGWQGWQAYQAHRGESASSRFTQLQQAVGAEQPAEIETAAKQLIAEHTGSAYATLAALQQAKQAYLAGDKTTAREQLEHALQNTDDAVLQVLTRLRLVDLLIDMQEWQAAQQQIDTVTGDAYAAEFAVRRGDLARQAGDKTAARQAYQEALNKGAGNRQLVQMKLDELGDS